MKYYKIIYSQSAVDDLESFHYYTTNVLLEPISANNIIQKLKNVIKSLNILPFRHPQITFSCKYNPKTRQFSVNGYTIFYEIEQPKKIVYVLRIISNKRDLSNCIN